MASYFDRTLLEFPGGYVEEVVVDQRTVDVTSMGDAYERRMPLGPPIVSMRLRLKNPDVINAVLAALGATREQVKETTDRYMIPTTGTRAIDLGGES